MKSLKDFIITEKLNDKQKEEVYEYINRLKEMAEKAEHSSLDEFLKYAKLSNYEQKELDKALKTADINPDDFVLIKGYSDRSVEYDTKTKFNSGRKDNQPGKQNYAGYPSMYYDENNYKITVLRPGPKGTPKYVIVKTPNGGIICKDDEAIKYFEKEVSMTTIKTSIRWASHLNN